MTLGYPIAFRLPRNGRRPYDEKRYNVANRVAAAIVECFSIRARSPEHAVASLTVENYVKTIALIAARNPDRQPGRNR